MINLSWEAVARGQRRTATHR